MAPLCAFIAFAIASHLSEAISLSAKPKKRLASQQLSLPDTSAVANGSQRVMNELATQVNSLQSRLNQVNQQGQDSLQKQKTAFEQILSQQAYENSELKIQNEGIVQQIQDYRSNSSKWRGQAEHLALACHQLKQDLYELSANMTLAQEFAHQTLNISAHMLEAPELRVLEELTQQDEVNQKDELHQFYLNAIAGEDATKLQMLQIGASPVGAPEDLLQSLMASIDELSRQQNQSLMKMKANFDMAYQKGVEVRNSLLEEQTKLNATRANERRLRDRLHQAADHLTKTRNELSHKLSALRVFHIRLGGHSVTPAYSLLQVGQKTLPEISTLMMEPRHVQDTLNSQISVLEAGLADKQHQSNQAITRLKADYESQLNAQADENEMIQRKNIKLAKYADDLSKNITALREDAKQLQAEDGQLVADLKIMKLNMSTAQEFTTLSLESTSAMLENASALSVLAELEEKDSASKHVRLHQELLQQVGKLPSLLQLAAASAKSQQRPQELLDSLEAALNVLSQEQNVSEASLKASFEEQFKIGTEKRSVLTKEQAKLNATIAEREALREHLRAAVNHLRATRNQLLEGSRSLRGYMKKVAYSQESSGSISLFQLSATRNVRSTLPDVHDVLKKPTGAFQMLNEHVAKLEQRLGEVQRQTAAEATNQMAEYEQQLQKQADVNRQIKTANLQLYTEIDALKNSSASLRQEANKQATVNTNLRSDLEALRTNLTSAQEVMSLALEAAEANLWNASQLNVLHVLDAEDAARAHEIEHERRLMSVAKSRDLALVELGATRGATPDPRDMLQQLLGSMDDLAKEKNASAEALKATFEKEFQAGNELRTSLLKEQANLNATKTHSTDLNNRLQEALKHLRATGSELAKQKESTQAFLRKLGLRTEASKSSNVQNKHEQPPNTIPSAAKGEVTEAYKTKQQEKPESQLRSKPDLSADVVAKNDGEVTEAYKTKQQEKPESQLRSKPDLSADVVAKNDEEQPKLSLSAVSSVNKGDQSTHQRQAKPGNKHTKQAKPVKQAKQAGPRNASDHGLAETAADAKVASGASRWLSPVESGIKWFLR